MISVNFNLRNPWSNRFENLWNRVYATPFEHKFVELEVYKDTSIISFAVQLTARQDYSGLDLELGAFGYNFHCQFYDNRHWNNQKKEWETHETNFL